MREVREILDSAIAFYSMRKKELPRGLSHTILPPHLPEVLVVGDLHGDYETLVRIIARFVSPQTWVVFLGDYVDRGRRQLDVLVKVLELKLRYPDRIVLLRGNHEDDRMNRYYGFYGQVPWEIYEKCQYLFKMLDLFALWPNKLFFVHGGIPRLNSYSLTSLLKEEVADDLVWNDPNQKNDYWLPNPRGIGWLFPPSAVKEFCRKIRVKAVVRGHEVRSGCEEVTEETKRFSGMLYTVFSTGSSKDSYYSVEPYVLLADRNGRLKCHFIW